MPSKHHPPQPGAGSEPGLERVVFFSDAVMAIAIALLAVDIRVPEIAPSSAPTELPGRLSAILPQALSFVISFIVIGVYSMSHHGYSRYIKRYDARLMLLNLVFLLFIAVLPFFSNLLGTYGQIPIAEALYALVVAGIGLSLLALWAYACHDHRLIDKELDRRFIRGTFPLAIGAPVTFLVSIPIAFVQSSLTPVVWWLTPLLGIAAAMYARRRAALPERGR